MTKTTILLLCLSTISHMAISQEDPPDSLLTLEEVTVRAFEQHRQASASGIIVKILESNNADRYNKTSLVAGFNTIAGVRMEERSPGSYRINIRGSSLRSPFGVRNVKVYWNDIPVTDAGGNTYFNQFAHNNFSSIEIVKGPVGSLYGAGTGGLVIMKNFERWQPGASLEYITGSYDLHSVIASARFGQAENRNQVSYSHNQSDGYRVQTKFRRDNLTWQSQLKFSDRQTLTASLLFSDMYYQTPGALNATEYAADPRAARPAAGIFPSAVAAKAAIFQKTILAGFSNEYQISPVLKNTTTLYGSYAQIKNPAVRNYERRTEPGFGGRTVFIFHKDRGDEGKGFQLVGGSEFQQGYYNIQVARNRNGEPDTLQTNDDVSFSVYNFFVQGDWFIHDKWFIAAGVSLNKSTVGFKRLSRYPVVKQSRSYQNEIAPRISLKRKFSDEISVSATASRGFSPPTTAELLPSTGVISTELEAEEGWNYELTTQVQLFKKRLILEATGFYFRLDHALVQRRDLSGADFFVNAGDVKQKGVEIQADYVKLIRSNILDYLSIKAAYTYSHFRYGSFIKGTDDFSGKTVPSVPSNTVSVIADLSLRHGFYSNATYYMASRIYLNDANTAIAEGYQLLGWRLGWKKSLNRKYRLNLYAGVDNLLDEVYSLGNDINAAAGRYYNAAPPRNYYAGIAFQFNCPKK